MRKISLNVFKLNALKVHKFQSSLLKSNINNKTFSKRTNSIKYSNLFYKPFFNFSTSNNPNSKKDSPSSSQHSHRQQQQKQQYMQNAQMIPDQQKKQTPFVPTAFGNYFIGISCAALLLAYALMQVQFMRAANTKKSPAEGAKKVVAKGKAHIGGDWELIGTNGQKITHKKFQGSYYLIYFGFCNCPDICPNSLMKLAKALEKIRKQSQSKFFNIQTVFVSVDPDRDTPQKIQKFAKYFDKSMIGVTGLNNQDPALKQCMKKFKIYSSKIQFQDQDSVVKGRKSYTIDHTILTYLMNPNNQYLAHIGANLGQHDIAKLIMEKIKQDQRTSMTKLKV